MAGEQRKNLGPVENELTRAPVTGLLIQSSKPNSFLQRILRRPADKLINDMQRAADQYNCG